MILNHLYGLYFHPKEEWKNIDRTHEKPTQAISHVLLIALIPAISAYIGAAEVGWTMYLQERMYLAPSTATVLAAGLYFGLCSGVVALSVLIHHLAKSFDAKPTFTQSLEVAAYTATPLFMAGLAGLYPQVWFLTLAILAGVAYSVYLLYSGVPIMMHIPEEKGFIFSSSVVTCGLVLLVFLMALSVILWTNIFTPLYL